MTGLLISLNGTLSGAIFDYLLLSYFNYYQINRLQKLPLFAIYFLF